MDKNHDMYVRILFTTSWDQTHSDASSSIDRVHHVYSLEGFEEVEDCDLQFGVAFSVAPCADQSVVERGSVGERVLC